MRPSSISLLSEFDQSVRLRIFRHAIETSRPPSIAAAAAALGVTTAEARDAYQRLAAEHLLVLQESGEILMAPPFSAVPTGFQVESRGRSWWAHCIWYALGVPALLHQDARIVTSCGCCNEEMVLSVEDGNVSGPPSVLHFAVPAARWWEDIVFT